MGRTYSSRSIVTEGVREGVRLVAASCRPPDPNAAALEVVALSEEAAVQVAAHHRNGGCCGRMNKQTVSVVLGCIDADRSNEELIFRRGVGEIIKKLFALIVSFFFLLFWFVLCLFYMFALMRFSSPMPL